MFKSSASPRYIVEKTSNDKGTILFLDIFRATKRQQRGEVLVQLCAINQQTPARRASDRQNQLCFIDPSTRTCQVLRVTSNYAQMTPGHIFDILVDQQLAEPHPPMETPMATEKQYTLAELQQVYDKLRNREIELAQKLHGKKEPVVPIKGAAPKFADVGQAYDAVKRQAGIVESVLRALNERDPKLKAMPETLDVERSKAVTSITEQLLA